MILGLFSDIGNCLSSRVSCSFDRNRCVSSCLYQCVFYRSLSVGSPVAEAVFIVLHLGWEGPKSSISPKCILLVIYLLLILCHFSPVEKACFVYCRMDCGVKSLGRMFSDVA